MLLTHNTFPTSASHKLALVVDDCKSQCLVLKGLLEEEGYRVVIAHDGASGVGKYIEIHPDLVLMDIIMPIMNGFEAARQIKKLSHNSLAPIIFITSMDSEQSFIDSVDAGGDSILIRPFTPEFFKAKIKSIQRIGDLYSQVKNLQQEQQKDEELAEQLLSSVIGARNYALDRIGIVKKAAAIFSGDIQLSVLCPNGDVNVLLGDFTGHGLRSSIGAIPLATTFRTMTQKGFSLLSIIKQINELLYDLLPSDIFLAATFLSISSKKRSVYMFNAGLPDAYIFSNKVKIKKVIKSQHPPIGILPQLLPNSRLEAHSIDHNDRIILISDGVIEARNTTGDMYGIDRFEQTVLNADFSQNIAVLIMQSVNGFCQNTQQEDDISIIDVPCNLDLEFHNNYSSSFYHELNTSQRSEQDRKSLLNEVDKDIEIEGRAPTKYFTSCKQSNDPLWQWQLTLFGDRLGKVNPVPIAMNHIQAIEGTDKHWQNLYTILTELFVNALDHGILKLSSALKDSPQGFVRYYNEREKNLSVLDYGYIDIRLRYHLVDNGGKMIITIKDSGEGFDSFALFKKNSISLDQNMVLSGRGLELVNQLSDTLEYKENGTLVEASYVWDQRNN